MTNPLRSCAELRCVRRFRVSSRSDVFGCWEHPDARPRPCPVAAPKPAPAAAPVPAPVAPDPLPAWAALGACVGLPPGPWDGDDPDDTAAAARVCHGECPVRLECGTWARAAGAWGVWGGVRLVDGRPVAHRRPAEVA